MLPDEEWKVVVGESLVKPVVLNIHQDPHFLIAGGTGSGKTTLVYLLLIQFMIRKQEVIIADFKGVDFGESWEEKCVVIKDEVKLKLVLEDLINIMEERKFLFLEAGCKNITEYNQKNENIKRIFVVLDEIRIVLGKEGKSKDDIKFIESLEKDLIRISSIGRVFGIHLAMVYQRPGREALNPNIKENLTQKICGKADSVMIKMVLDSSETGEIIRESEKGVFMMHDRVKFKSYYVEDQYVKEVLNNYEGKNLIKR